jgi:hypothetical protein
MSGYLQTIRRVAAAMLVLAAWAPSASAQTPGRPLTLPMAVEQSELIFLGTVTDVAFRLSADAGDGFAVLPHTFVTYRIEDTLRGAAPGNEITLRFLGGYSPETGRVMLAPGARFFREGDRDVILVAGNGRYACPMVGCSGGRFRIVDGRAYSNSGLAVRIAGEDLAGGPDALPDGAITMTVPAAPRARIAELRRRLSDDTTLDGDARKDLEARIVAMSSPRTLGISRPGPTPGAIPTTPPASQAELLVYLRRLAATAPPPTGRVASADPDAPFRVKALTPTRAERSGRPAEPRPLTPEQQLLRRNGGNPVIEGGARP